MNAKEKAALSDFVATVVWPGRTVRAVTTPAGEQDFTITAAWDTTHDTPMAWIDGNRVPWDEITWNSPTSIRLPTLVPFGRLVIILISPGAGARYMPRNPNGAAFLGDVNVGGHRLTKLAPSEEPDDAVRRDEVVAIAQALVGANYALLTGAVFTGNVTVPLATEAGHAVRRDQVALLNGTQPFTAEQQGVAASNAAGLTTKGQMEAAINAASSSPRLPNRYQRWGTPGVFSWTVPAGVTKVWVRIASGAGGAGGGNTLVKGGDGAPGKCVIVALAVTPGTTATLKVGGGGYGSTSDSQRPGGGGGGSASRFENGANSVSTGGGGGGGGKAGIDIAGNGGAGGTAGANGDNGGGGYPGSAGGAAGTLGAGAENAGTGGAGMTTGGDGSQGSATANPPEALTVYDESWAFGGIVEPAGGISVMTGSAGNGGHGYIELRWYEA